MHYKIYEMKNLHVILGANGAVGMAIVKQLQLQNLPYRTVQRSMGSEPEHHRQADLLDPEETKNAIEGAAYVYLCTGLPYESKVWEMQWPLLMQNVINACVQHSAKLIFLDNMYMYGPAPLAVPYDESTPQQAFTRKGKVRKAVADMMLQAMQSGKLKGVIGRAADFYGPGATNSVLYFSFLERMLIGKAPQTLLKKGVVHTFASTTDVANAMVLLALDENNNGEVYHLPVGEAVTMDEMVNHFNEAFNTNLRPAYLPPFMVGILSLFIKPISEIKEMMYQFHQPYIMSWEKFKSRYPSFAPIGYKAGVKEMVDYFKTKGVTKNS